MTSSPWKKLFCHNLMRSFYICCQMNLSVIFWDFQNGRHFEDRVRFLNVSCTENWVEHQDSQSTFLHYEFLIDVLAKQLTELWLFQNLTQLFDLWPRKTIHFCIGQGYICGSSLVMMCHSVRELSKDTQTDKQTNIPLNEHTCKFLRNFGK